MTPKTTNIRQDNTHRLIPSCHRDDSVLQRLAGNEDELQALFDLDSGTNDRMLGEANLLPGISVHELLFGVEYAPIVNAAFTHVRPSGSRFNSFERGAWYASFKLETAEAEIAFHKSQELQEINWREPETFTFDDYLADFRADFHDLRGSAAYARYLNPHSYAGSQKLAADLLSAGAAGIVYPSVRYSRGTCIVCFRPALVTNVRQGQIVTMTFRDAETPPVIGVRSG